MRCISGAVDFETSFYDKHRPAAFSSGSVFVSLFGQHDAVVGQQFAVEGGVSPVGQQDVLPLVINGDGLILSCQVADDKQLHTQILKIVQLGGDTLQIAFTVSVGIAERLGVKLIYDLYCLYSQKSIAKKNHE